jgi:hypothetical protein
LVRIQNEQPYSNVDHLLVILIEWSLSTLKPSGTASAKLAKGKAKAGKGLT